MSENIKTRKYYRVHNGTDWDRMHFVTDANSVDANDGDNMETKVGAIKGITTSTEVTEEGYAADATTVAALNSSLGGLSFYEDETGKYVVGADSVPKKLGSGGSFCITNLVLYDYISGSAPEANDQGNLSISGSGRSSFEIDTKDFTTLYIGTISGKNSTINVNGVTTSSNSTIDITDVDIVTISFSFSISASKNVTYGNGSASNSGTTTISSLTFE